MVFLLARTRQFFHDHGEAVLTGIISGLIAGSILAATQIGGQIVSRQMRHTEQIDYLKQVVWTAFDRTCVYRRATSNPDATERHIDRFNRMWEDVNVALIYNADTLTFAQRRSLMTVQDFWVKTTDLPDTLRTKRIVVAFEDLSDAGWLGRAECP